MTTPHELSKDIIHLKQRGYSSRFIAECFLGSSSKKSTVNDIVARYVKENGNAYDKQEIEQRKANCMEDLGYYKKKTYKDEVEKEYYQGFAYRGNKLPEKKKVTKEGSLKIMVIPDPQVKVGESTEYLSAIGQYIVDKKPDVVVCLGDFWDMTSLSSYDKGKTAFEGRRVTEDIEAGKAGMKAMLKPLKDYKAKYSDYNPRMVFTVGNHDFRLQRVADNNSEYDGFIGMHLLELENDWEVVPFLKPVVIQGISFVHYLTHPMNGKPMGGNALSQLKASGSSFVVGHKQTLDVAIMPVLDGSMRIGIIAGASYPFDEAYKGTQLGNKHFRGLVMLHEAKEGYADPSFISTEFLINRLKGNNE